MFRVQGSGFRVVMFYKKLEESYASHFGVCLMF